ncbi:MAG TPA: aspartate-semialdehyde dehydrogenase [Candidatus Fermentibacter daniensis]|nr:aspartate-semialdehyde dehydrogenase [Candidatus Fermentibacter daniensis]HOR06759.1 aspartate-semialdehyde dehydrogenase [Candidatus Fermentibacter daniensis]HPK50988.1 aspartate-semialdehyde dehydrogenase [Candidatus Fermentibacter daniensis]
MRVGVVGATGLVGMEMVRLVRERIGLPASSFLAFASDASRGRTLDYGPEQVSLSVFDAGDVGGGDYLLGATGAEVAGVWVPAAVERGAVVIDNSSRFRMDEGVPLVVPEVNIATIPAGCRLIANPNCSTIQLVVVLAPLAKAFGIEWAAVSTYQSVSGAGSRALVELERQEAGLSDAPEEGWFHRNVLTSIGGLDGDLYCEEEVKLARETGRIIGAGFPVFPACARVPVAVGHLESVTVRFDEPVGREGVLGVLRNADGVSLSEDGAAPRSIQGTSEVFVGRVRQSPVDSRTVQMWITADNVRKGAALNAVQILESLLGRSD